LLLAERAMRRSQGNVRKEERAGVPRGTLALSRGQMILTGAYVSALSMVVDA
jgi:hypothetical protein